MRDFLLFVVASVIGGIISGIAYDIFKQYFAHRTPYTTDDPIEDRIGASESE